MITGGTIKYGETRKMADFENKRADVELSFNIPEDSGAFEAGQRILEVARMAKGHCVGLFNAAVAAEVAPLLKISNPVQVAVGEPPKFEEVKSDTTKPHNRLAPKMPLPEAENKPTDPTALEEPKGASEIITEMVKLNPDASIELVTGVKIITDADLMDAVSKRQQDVRNPVAIRKLLAEVLTAAGIACPPGRVVDIPQDKRQEFFDGLKLIKPLA